MSFAKRVNSRPAIITSETMNRLIHSSFNVNPGFIADSQYLWASILILLTGVYELRFMNPDLQQQFLRYIQRPYTRGDASCKKGRFWSEWVLDITRKKKKHEFMYYKYGNKYSPMKMVILFAIKNGGFRNKEHSGWWRLVVSSFSATTLTLLVSSWIHDGDLLLMFYQCSAFRVPE